MIYGLKGKTTLETGGKDAKLHSKRVEKIRNYTRNEWKRFETTLETSEELKQMQSKRVNGSLKNYFCFLEQTIASAKVSLLNLFSDRKISVQTLVAKSQELGEKLYFVDLLDHYESIAKDTVSNAIEVTTTIRL